jgi:hypothetical protein
VTNNAADFRKLYADQSLHAGLMILIPNVTANLRTRLLKGAVDTLATHSVGPNRASRFPFSLSHLETNGLAGATPARGPPGELQTHLLLIASSRIFSRPTSIAGRCIHDNS